MGTFQHLHQPTARLLAIDGQEFLFFGGTAYLGLLANTDYIALFKEGIDRYGLNNGTSRSNNVQLGIYDDVEHYLAERFGFAASAVFSSGYLAAQAAVSALTKGKTVFYAPDSHPSLWVSGSPGNDLPFEQWIAQTVAAINESPETEFVLVSNTLDNLTPKKYDFTPLKNIQPSKKVTLVLDDSHGICIVHKNAISMDAALFAQDNMDLLVLASLAKGMGTDAGLVLGSTTSIRQIKSHPIFMGSSPPSPASMYALLHGQDIYEKEFNTLHKNISIFRELLPGHLLNSIPHFPVFTSTDSHLYRHLIRQNILISSFPYPLPDSPLLNRIVFSALHKREDIERLCKAINKEAEI